MTTTHLGIKSEQLEDPRYADAWPLARATELLKISKIPPNNPQFGDLNGIINTTLLGVETGRLSAPQAADFVIDVVGPDQWGTGAPTSCCSSARLLIAGSQTVIVLTPASLTAYYLSRFQFPGCAAMLRQLLVLHAFPVLTLIVPMSHCRARRC